MVDPIRDGKSESEWRQFVEDFDPKKLGVEGMLQLREQMMSNSDGLFEKQNEETTLGFCETSVALLREALLVGDITDLDFDFGTSHAFCADIVANQISRISEFKHDPDSFPQDEWEQMHHDVFLKMQHFCSLPEKDRKVLERAYPLVDIGLLVDGVNQGYWREIAAVEALYTPGEMNQRRRYAEAQTL